MKKETFEPSLDTSEPDTPVQQEKGKEGERKMEKDYKKAATASLHELRKGGLTGMGMAEGLLENLDAGNLKPEDIESTQREVDYFIRRAADKLLQDLRRGMKTIDDIEEFIPYLERHGLKLEDMGSDEEEIRYQKKECLRQELESIWRDVNKGRKDSNYWDSYWERAENNIKRLKELLSDLKKHNLSLKNIRSDEEGIALLEEELAKLAKG